MRPSKADDAAYPMPYCPTTDSGGCEGMSMREWYAGMAMSGLMANTNLAHLMDNGLTPWKGAEICFMAADAMLAEGKKDRTKGDR